MSLPGRWSFWLANSGDMSNITSLVRTHESASNLRLTSMGRNLPGGFSCDLPITSRAALVARCDSTCIRAERTPASGGPGTTKWSGFIQSISSDVDAEKTSITAIGWFEEANQRQIRPSEAAAGSTTFASTVGGSIAKSLLALANQQTDSLGNTWPMHLRVGSVGDSQVRTRAYTAGTTFGSAIDGLSQIEDGYDWVVDPSTRELNTLAPDDFADHPNVVFRHGVNLDGPVVTEDGTRSRNRFTIIGPGGIVVVVDDPQAIAEAGKIIDEQVTISDTGGSGDPVAVMQAYGNAQLAFLSRPPITITFKPRSLGDVPRPYDEFDWGDQVYATIVAGRVDLDRQPVRAFKGDFSFTDEGDEIVDEMTISLG